MRISDWSSDVCSSDLSLRRKRWVRLQADEREQFGLQLARQPRELVREAFADDREELEERDPRVARVVVVPFAQVARDAVAERLQDWRGAPGLARKSVVYGKSVVVCVGLGGRRN